MISRTSTQKYKSAPDNLRDIARQLGVANILEGSVQRSNDRVRVNVQLINALTDAHFWADTFDRNLTDIFAVESEIAKMIAETLQAKLTGSEKATDRGATNQRHDCVRALPQRQIALGKTLRRQSAEGDRVLRTGNRTRSKVRARLCRSG